MTKFKVTCRCRECGTVFSRILRRADAADPQCPKRSCRVVHANIGIDLAAAPPAIGGSNVVRAVDRTAEIVMQDHGLTNLQDRLRQGDSMVPKLAPALEAQVSSFWGGGGGRMPRQQAARLQQMGQRALTGAYTGGQPDVMSATHKLAARPKVHFEAG